MRPLINSVLRVLLAGYGAVLTVLFGTEIPIYFSYLSDNTLISYGGFVVSIFAFIAGITFMVSGFTGDWA